jgi:predicted phage tail protein
VAGGVTVFQDTSLTSGTTYYYRVRARNASGFSDYSTEASATTPMPPPPVPGAPSDLGAVVIDTSTIDLGWTASGGLVDGYHIERSLTPGSGFVAVDTVAGGMTVFQDTSLESGTTYYYRVRARNISGFSDYSAEASATIPVPAPPVPGAPADLAAAALDTSTIDLSWTASAGVVDGYHVERSTTPGDGFAPVDTVAGGVTVFQDTSLVSGTTYYYRVRGRNISGFSDYSAEASATTADAPPQASGATTERGMRVTRQVRTDAQADMATASVPRTAPWFRDREGGGCSTFADATENHGMGQGCPPSSRTQAVRTKPTSFGAREYATTQSAGSAGTPPVEV